MSTTTEEQSDTIRREDGLEQIFNMCLDLIVSGYSMDIAGKYFPIASQHADIMEEGLTRIRASMRAYAKEDFAQLMQEYDMSRRLRTLDDTIIDAVGRFDRGEQVVTSEEILSQPTRQLAARSVPLKRAELDRLRKELEEVQKENDRLLKEHAEKLARLKNALANVRTQIRNLNEVSDTLQHAQPNQVFELAQDPDLA